MSHEHTIDAGEYAKAIAAYRQQKDEFFGTSPQSPISDDDINAGFTGLPYFAADLAYRVEATLTPFVSPTTVELGSTKGDIRRYLRYGELTFTLGGQQCRLTAYKDASEQSADELFIPFRDATSGTSSYPAGRYLEVEDSDGAAPHTLTLDFNIAYSPWCAYNSAYSCTLPPRENTLTVAVEAGERTYALHD